MDANDLIDALGGSAAVASAVGSSQFAVANWRKRGIPAWAMPAMQRLCDEKQIEAGGLLAPQPPRRAREKVA